MIFINLKSAARNFFGVARVIEGICLSTNSGEYPKLYWFPLKEMLGETVMLHILMTGITSIIFGGGALTLANNPTGFQLAGIGFLIKIVILYLPKIYMESYNSE